MEVLDDPTPNHIPRASNAPDLVRLEANRSIFASSRCLAKLDTCVNFDGSCGLSATKHKRLKQCFTEVEMTYNEAATFSDTTGTNGTAVGPRIERTFL